MTPFLLYLHSANKVTTLIYLTNAATHILSLSANVPMKDTDTDKTHFVELRTCSVDAEEARPRPSGAKFATTQLSHSNLRRNMQQLQTRG